MNPGLKLAIASLMGAAANHSQAALTIDTSLAWNGTSNASYFGEPDSATYGQTITAPITGGKLDSFTFYLSALDLNFKAYVYAWDGSTAVGPALYASASTNIGDGFTGFRPVTFNTGGVDLVAGNQYVLFFSVSGLEVGMFNTNTWGALRTDGYADGEFVLHNSTNDFASLVNNPNGWDCGNGCDYLGRSADLVFKAVISDATAAVPEPVSSGLMLSGLALVAALARRKRSSLR